MKRTLFIFIGLLITNGLIAQTGNLTGKILQSDSLTPLPFANVYLEQINAGTITSGNGSFHINDVPEGQYTLVVSSIGMLTEKRAVEVKSGVTQLVEIVMTESIATLGEVVVMTRGIAGLKHIPGSVHYIPPREMQRFSSGDVNRLLRFVPGVNVVEEEGFGLRPSIGLRGTGVDRSSKITLMEDGVLIAPAPYSAPAAYYFPSVGRIQAIEVLKGSSQIKYGPYTTGGAINLISTGIPNDLSFRMHLLAGSFGHRSLHAYAGNSNKNAGFLVETYQQSADGFKKLDGSGKTGFDKKDYTAKVRINTNPESNIYQSLTIKLGRSEEVGDETYLGLTQADFDESPFRRYAASQKDQITTNHQIFTATHQISFNNDMRINTTAYRTDFDRNWYKLDKVKDDTGKSVGISQLLDNPALYPEAYLTLTGSSLFPENVLIVKANNRKYYAQGVQTALDYGFRTNKLSHDINVGLRIHNDEMDRFQWEDEFKMENGTLFQTDAGIPGTESNRVESATALAAHVQYRIRYGLLSFIPGLRYENIAMERKNWGRNDPERLGENLVISKNNVDVFIPGIGINFYLDAHTNLFAGVHKGFSPPGAQEETMPEESISYELGGRYRKESFLLSGVVFFNNYSNLLGADLAASGGSGSGDLFNAGKVHAKGVELQVSYDLLSSAVIGRFALPVSLVYTFTDATFRNSFKSSYSEWGEVEAGDRMPYIAGNQLAGYISLEHRSFNVNLGGRFIDGMRTRPGKGEIPENEKIDSYLLFDLSSNVTVDEGIRLFVNVINLTDKVYVAARRPAGLRPGMPRAFNFGVKVDF